MRKLSWLVMLGLLVSGSTSWGQAPPGLPGAAPAEASAAAAGASGAAGLLGALSSKCKQCKQCFCASPLGMMFSSMLTPISAFSGGLVSPCCPNPVSELANSANPPGGSSGAVATAAAIQADQASAAARRSAVRYLGTCDCHYWPEAEMALIASLRTDRNECVRWEAAMALTKGCCCTNKTIAALTIVVTGSDKDGNPSETSCRVINAAMVALTQCLESCAPQPEPARPEFPNPPEAGTSTASIEQAIQQIAAMGLSTDYYTAIALLPRDQVMDQARIAREAVVARSRVDSMMPMTGDRGLVNIVRYSWQRARETESMQVFAETVEPGSLAVTSPPVPAVAEAAVSLDTVAIEPQLTQTGPVISVEAGYSSAPAKPIEMESEPSPVIASPTAPAAAPIVKRRLGSTIGLRSPIPPKVTTSTPSSLSTPTATPISEVPSGPSVAEGVNRIEIIDDESENADKVDPSVNSPIPTKATGKPVLPVKPRRVSRGILGDLFVR